MGTNFYVDAEPTCNNPAHTGRLHVGKSSGGWEFALRGHLDLGLVDWPTWRAYLEAAVADGRVIKDVYGEPFTIEQLQRRVFRIGANPARELLCHRTYLDGSDHARYLDPDDDVHHPPSVETGPNGYDVCHREFS